MAEPISAACGAWDDLWGAGFPDPVLGNTGNGTHLLVDLPNGSDKYALAKRPKKRPLLHARQETAGYDGVGQIDGEILVKVRGLLQYLRRDGPTDGTDPAFKRQTNDQLLQGLVLTPNPLICAATFILAVPSRSSLFSAVSVSAVCAIAWRSNARIWAPCSKASALGGVRHNVPLIHPATSSIRAVSLAVPAHRHR